MLVNCFLREIEYGNRAKPLDKVLYVNHINYATGALYLSEAD